MKYFSVPHRYLNLIPTYNATVWDFYNNYFLTDTALLDALYRITDKRGPEPLEMQQEIEVCLFFKYKQTFFNYLSKQFLFVGENIKTYAWVYFL